MASGTNSISRNETTKATTPPSILKKKDHPKPKKTNRVAFGSKFYFKLEDNNTLNPAKEEQLPPAPNKNGIFDSDEKFLMYVEDADADIDSDQVKTLEKKRSQPIKADKKSDDRQDAHNLLYLSEPELAKYRKKIRKTDSQNCDFLFRLLEIKLKNNKNQSRTMDSIIEIINDPDKHFLEKSRLIGDIAEKRAKKRGFFNDVFSSKNKDIYEALSVLKNTKPLRLEENLATALLPFLNKQESIEISPAAHLRKTKEVVKSCSSILTTQLLLRKLPPNKIKIKQDANDTPSFNSYFIDLPSKLFKSDYKEDKQKRMDIKKSLGGFLESIGLKKTSIFSVDILADQLAIQFSLDTLKKGLKKIKSTGTRTLSDPKLIQINKHINGDGTADQPARYRPANECCAKFFACFGGKEAMPEGIQAIQLVLQSTLNDKEKKHLIEAIGIYKRNNPSTFRRSQQTKAIYSKAAKIKEKNSSTNDNRQETEKIDTTVTVNPTEPVIPSC